MLPSQVIRLALAPPLRLLKTLNGIRYLGHDAGIRGAIERLKRPSRGGQNLSDRYIRLEKSLRGKEALSKDLGDLTRPSVAAGSVKPQGKAANNLFRGFEVPEEPRPPQDDECCMSGCAICVYDLYEDSIQAYKQSVASLRASLSALNIPESEWPPTVRISAGGIGKKENVALSAFEAMERSLKEKRDQAIAAGQAEQS